MVRAQGNGKEKSRSFPEFAFHPNPTAVHFYEFFCDVEPESGAAELPGYRGVNLLEFFKNVFELFLGYADSVIVNAIEQIVPLLLDPDRHASMLTEFQRVSYQVHQTLGDSF